MEKITFKELVRLAKEQNLTLTKIKEEGMIRPIYVIESDKYGKDYFSFKMVKFLITNKVFAE